MRSLFYNHKNVFTLRVHVIIRFTETFHVRLQITASDAVLFMLTPFDLKSMLYFNIKVYQNALILYN